MRTIRHCHVQAAAVCLLALAPALLAGDLNPASPPTSGTMKTLDQVEPRIPIPASAVPTTVFSITQSGSYYLTGDRRCSETGIDVSADNVTIDLCGYSLTGPAAADNNAIYIFAHHNIHIRNGTLRDFKRGIFATGTCRSLHVSDVRVLANTSAGIYLDGTDHVVRDCVVTDNGFSSPTAWPYGIHVGKNSTISGSTVANTGKNFPATAGSNRIYGIWADSGSTLTGNSSCGNGAGAVAAAGSYLYVYGIYAAEGCILAGNTARYNGAGASGNCQTYGILASGGCKVSGNIADYNAADVTGTGSEDARVYGIFCMSGSVVADNTVCSNGASNTARVSIYGLWAGEGCTVRGNSASYNGQFSGGIAISGIETDAGCTVIGNTAYRNGNLSTSIGEGIKLVGYGVVDQNTAVSNYGHNMVNPGSGVVTADNYAP